MGENGLYWTSRQPEGIAKFKYVICVDIYSKINYLVEFMNIDFPSFSSLD